MKAKITSLLLLLFCAFLLTLTYYNVNSQELHHIFYKVTPASMPAPKIIKQSSTPSNPEAESFSLHGKYICLMDADTMDVLYSKDGTKKAPMASTTKIMTCLLALTLSSQDDVVEVSSYAASMPDVQLGMKKGETYYMKDLLYSLMLESHNDTAVAIAEHIGGSVEGFARLMNQKAVELGCRDTSFVTPNGLDAEGHYTTANDLARITAYALQNKRFCELIQTPSHTFQDKSGKCSFSVSNKDAFLNQYQGAIGVKTGFTGKAGYCFVGAVSLSDRTLISVTLAAGWPPHKTYKWSDTKTLMDYGRNSFSRLSVDLSNTVIESIPVENGTMPYVALTLDSTSISHLRRNMLVKQSDEVRLNVVMKPILSAPVKEGLIVGSLLLEKNGVVILQLPIRTNQAVEKTNYIYALTKLLSLFMKY